MLKQLLSIKSSYKIIVISLLILIILLISVAVIQNKKMLVDSLSYNFFVLNLRSTKLTKIMKIITNFCNIEVIIIIFIIATLCLKDIKKAIIIPINAILITSINHFLKEIFKRPRPSGYKLIHQGGYSYPSGHAMLSLAFYGFLIYLSSKLIKNKPLKILSITINSILIILIGISRIYLGVHYATDVIAGYAISLIYLFIFNYFLNKRNIIT